MDYGSGQAGVTESPLAVEEEHSPGVGCMLRGATQAPTGEDNCHRWMRGCKGRRSWRTRWLSVTSTQAVDYTLLTAVWTHSWVTDCMWEGTVEFGLSFVQSPMMDHKRMDGYHLYILKGKKCHFQHREIVQRHFHIFDSLRIKQLTDQ